MENVKISVIIPMYNEISTVCDTAHSLTGEMEAYCGQTGDTYEIIFSDDGSYDGCFDAVPDDIELHCGEIKKIRSDVNRGKGAAVRSGILESVGDIAVYTDCDLAYGSVAVSSAVRTIRENNADVLVGSRAIHPNGYDGYTFSRKLASKAYMKLLSVFAGFRLSDSQCGLKAFRGELARDIFAKLQTDGWAFDFEAVMLAEQRKAVFIEMPVKIVNHRESRVNVVRDSLKMLSELRKIKKRLAK